MEIDQRWTAFCYLQSSLFGKYSNFISGIPGPTNSHHRFSHEEHLISNQNLLSPDISQPLRNKYTNIQIHAPTPTPLLLDASCNRSREAR
jgi:hypothetical protein